MRQLVVKEKFGKISKSLKILWSWLQLQFHFQAAKNVQHFSFFNDQSPYQSWCFEVAYRVQIGKTHFFKILKSLVTVLLKITFVCIYLLFIKTPLCKPIENCHIKLCHVYFNDFNMLFKNIQLQILYNSDLDKSLYQWTFSSQ